MRGRKSSKKIKTKRASKKLQAIWWPLLLAFSIQAYFTSLLAFDLFRVQYDVYKFVIALVLIFGELTTVHLVLETIGKRGLISRELEPRIFLCHHDPRMTFHLLGRRFVVCSRCTGFYFGLLLAGFVLFAQRTIFDFVLRQGWVASLGLGLVLSMLTPLQGAYYRIHKLTGHKFERFFVGLASGISPVFYVATLVSLAFTTQK